MKDGVTTDVEDRNRCWEMEDVVNTGDGSPWLCDDGRVWVSLRRDEDGISVCLKSLLSWLVANRPELLVPYADAAAVRQERAACAVDVADCYCDLMDGLPNVEAYRLALSHAVKAIEARGKQ